MLADSIRIHLERCLYYQDGPHWNYGDTCYPYNTLYFVLGGDGEVSVGEQTTALRAGFLYLIPAGTTFRCRCRSRIEKVYADVRVELVPGYDVFSGIKGVRELACEVQECLALKAACAQETLACALFVRGVVTKSVARFVDQGGLLQDQDLLPFRAILDDIDRSLSSRLKVRDIAARHHCDPAALTKRFKKVFHCSMKQYMDQMLLNRLKSALLLTDRTIRELAEDFGFCDQYYLCSFFKKHESVSPSRYRRENRRP